MRAAKAAGMGLIAIPIDHTPVDPDTQPLPARGQQK
jgi:hypothetical protein